MVQFEATNPESASEIAGYYGVPVIHGPHWKWLIVGYFFFGGIAGGAAAIGGLARVFGGRTEQPVVRAARYVTIAALIPCPPLLILDLGRPGRFLNMLRAFRPSSPMSVGTWGLSVFGMVTTLLGAMQLAEDLRPRPSTDRGTHHVRSVVEVALAALSAVFGLFVAGYTGVLLAATAVPLWSKRPSLLAPLFLTSAVSSGAAAVATAVALLDPEGTAAEDGLRQLETVAAIAEGLLLTTWVYSLGATARPLVEGDLGLVVRDGVIAGGMSLPLAIGAISERLPGRAKRAAGLLASVLTLAGVLALRYAVVEGGRRSADDPQATFAMTG
jgi:formate-dependent nitrite reductase membrane component NrfD